MFDEKDFKCLFEGNVFICCLVCVGVFDEFCMKFDYVLVLKIEDFFECCFQICVYKFGFVKFIYYVCVFICQCYICVGKQIVNVFFFIVCFDFQKYIDFFFIFFFGGGCFGCVCRKKVKVVEVGDGEEEEDEE